MLINRNNLALAALASKNSTRWNLCGLHVNEKETVATDGHALGVVTLPTNASAEDYPPVDGVARSTEAIKPCTIPAAAAKELERAIPKRQRMPVLEHVYVDAEATNAGTEFKAATTDLETTRKHAARKVEGEFVDYTQVIPNGTPSFTIGFDAALLSKVLAVAGKMTDKSKQVVKLEFTDADSPVKITATNLSTGQIGTFVVMPCRLKDE
jgi:DNA polymerase III sliding clamp (beta) subunit (PCNA family)